MKPFPALLLLFLLLLAGGGSAQAGPVFDPFLESFQVGAFTDPQALVLDHGYPADLLSPALLDTLWLKTALDLLAGDTAQGPAIGILLRQWQGNQQVNGWREESRTMITGMLDRRMQTLPQGGPAFGSRLWFAAGTAAFTEARATGRNDLALELALALSGAPTRDRVGFIWDLRARRIQSELVSGGSDDGLWPRLLDLEPFDSNSGWALWVAHRRHRGLALLVDDHREMDQARFLAGLQESHLTAADLQGSGFPEPVKAGLGGVILPLGELAAHFERFPDPPPGFTEQGWWVSGQRKMVRGQPAAYEDLAGRSDLRSGWRLDVWRRASELRLLKGNWEAGLQDLQKALAIARDGGGTESLRLRLRQWVEQAMALALAHRDTALARRVHQMGVESLGDTDREAFLKETGHWAFLSGPESARTPAGTGMTPSEAAALRVCRGGAPVLSGSWKVLEPGSAGRPAADLWEIWRRWGLSLAEGAIDPAAAPYAVALGALDPGQAEGFPAGALAAAGGLLAGHPDLPRLLEHLLWQDVFLALAGMTPAPSSAIPALAAGSMGSPLQRHALLGIALYQGDLRGILGAAVLIPQGNLLTGEKMLFLYPLPGAGPISAALASAGSDPALLLAVARNESLFDAGARSRAGALGWMQIMPFHFPQGGAVRGPEHWGVPAVSIAKGDELLQENRRRFEGDPYLTLAGYNAGPEAALRWRRQLGGTQPPDIYLAWIGYPETRHYVEKVLIDREIYGAILGGGIPGYPDR